MTEQGHYADDLRRAWAGASWQGPALRELLKDVTPQQAARKPLKNAHSIWELVGHIAAWHGVVRKRMDGKKSGAPSASRNFPCPAKVDAGAWEAAKRALGESALTTADRIARFPKSRLGDVVPGKRYDYRHLLSGVAHHDAYHAGQIALLKKAASGKR